MKRISFVTVLLSLLLSACAQATPTVDPAQIQASAVAAANTMVALTQAAIPTDTPEPPTPEPSPTPLPSPTLLALPTLSIDVSPTVEVSTGSTSTGGDPCNAPLPSKTAGPKTNVKIVNENAGPIILSLYLYKTPFGECGYRGFNIGGHGQIYVAEELPQGCYFGGALINDPKKPSKAFGDGMCMNNDDKWTMLVGSEVIRLQTP